MDSVKRAAALPVGAARQMRSGRAPLPLAALSCTAMLCSRASSLTTVVVLPVPGPPVMMAKALVAASAPLQPIAPAQIQASLQVEGSTGLRYRLAYADAQQQMLYVMLIVVGKRIFVSTKPL